MNYPEYPKIRFDRIPDLSIVYKCGGNKFTGAFSKYIEKFPYDPPPTHTFLHIENGLCMNVGIFTSLEKIEDILLKSKQYFVMTFTDLTEEQTREGKKYAYLQTGGKKQRFRLYDWRGYLYFGLRYIPGLNRLLKPSKRDPFCSDLVIDLFHSINHAALDKVDDEKTSPAKLFMLLENYPTVITREIIF